MDKGAFREDLFYRINVIPILVPPLRERMGDIPLLADYFLRTTRMKTGKDIQGISSEAMKVLSDHHWPGNVRELKSAFEYAFVVCHEPMIQPSHLPPNILGKQKGRKTTGAIPGSDDHVKRNELIEALTKAEGNQSEAARLLGISRVTVWNRIKKYGIHVGRNVNG